MVGILSKEQMQDVINYVNNGDAPPIPESDIEAIASAYSENPSGTNRWGLTGTVVAMGVDKVRGQHHKLRENKARKEPHGKPEA